MKRLVDNAAKILVRHKKRKLDQTLIKKLDLQRSVV